ncbi:MAG: hypothetical protein J5850_00385 [Clostridia bacterium]|nr:hypothetical protein [Clostridia bacterium]
MKDPKYKIELSDFERREIISILMETRNQFIEDNVPTEDLNELLEKLLGAKPVRRTEIKDRDER